MDELPQPDPQPAMPPEPVAPASSPITDMLAGAGLGLLLGLLVGLSTSPVVGVVVGTLTSLLAVVLGLQGSGGTDGKTPALARLHLHGVRIASFGLAAVIGVLAGLYVRINNPLAQSPEQQLARWTRTFPDNPVLAAQMMISERSGLNSAKLAFDPKAEGVAVTVSAGAAAKGAGLFSSVGQRDLCRELDPRRFDNDSAKILDAYDTIEPLVDTARQVRALPDDAQRRAALQTAHTVLCVMKGKGASQ
jgi:hypothetical protein